MSKFALRKLVVDKACGKKLKVLEPGEYLFSNTRYDSFFMEGVVIQAIVGKNGCGKSSLVEMLFRMSNNLAALMLRGYPRPESERIHFIPNVIAELTYDLDGVEGRLKCEKNSVSLFYGEESFVWSLEDDNCVHKIGEVVVERETRFEKEVIAATKFFYTIATNYSLQAYISKDYAMDGMLDWSEGAGWRESYDSTSWIDGVFHKNDGYMSPIVINPYRKEGVIDMSQEERRTSQRLCSLLWETKDDPDDSQLIEGYRLHKITYSLSQNNLKQKFDMGLLSSLPDGPISSKFTWAYEQDYSIAKSILAAYGLDLKRTMSLVEITSRIYLAYKTLKIAGKYPSYGHFSSLGDVNLIFQVKPEKSYHTKAEELVSNIQDDRSHITLKIRQTLKLIEVLTASKSVELFEKEFTYREYIASCGISEKVDSIMDRMALLPPPFFKETIYIVRNSVFRQVISDYEDVEERNRILELNAIRLNDLSSGERQFIFTTSTIVYHAFNLKSIPKVVRVSYNNLFLVLDEIEICFHPEYQRTFISKFLALLKRTGIANRFGVYVLIVTHSPFVLSDIPQGNIMYLKKGHQLTDDEKRAEGITNPFCANINDVLHQSFFLDKGFVGEFARQKVLSLVDYLCEKGNRDDWTAEKARDFIMEIGEPLVRQQMLDIYRDSSEAGVKDKIALYEKEIQKLKKDKR